MRTITVDPQEVHEIITGIMGLELDYYDTEADDVPDYKLTQTYGCLVALNYLGILTEAEYENYLSTFCTKLEEMDPWEYILI